MQFLLPAYCIRIPTLHVAQLSRYEKPTFVSITLYFKLILTIDIFYVIGYAKLSIVLNNSTNSNNFSLMPRLCFKYTFTGM